MSYMLKLPDERGAQLRLISEAEGKSVTGLIGEYIRSKVAAGVIPADLPNVVAKRTLAGLDLTLRGFAGSVPTNEISAFMAALRGATKLMSEGMVRKQWPIEGIASLSGIKVKRMAQGVKLISPLSGQEYPLASGVAADLADQIESELR